MCTAAQNPNILSKKSNSVCKAVYIQWELVIKFKKIKLWLTDPKGATPINKISATYRLMAGRRDNVISITLRQV